MTAWPLSSGNNPPAKLETLLFQPQPFRGTRSPVEHWLAELAQNIYPWEQHFGVLITGTRLTRKEGGKKFPLSPTVDRYKWNHRVNSDFCQFCLNSPICHPGRCHHCPQFRSLPCLFKKGSKTEHHLLGNGALCKHLPFWMSRTRRIMSRDRIGCLCRTRV